MAVWHGSEQGYLGSDDTLLTSSLLSVSRYLLEWVPFILGASRMECRTLCLPLGGRAQHYPLTPQTVAAETLELSGKGSREWPGLSSWKEPWAVWPRGGLPSSRVCGPWSLCKERGRAR